MATCWHCGRSGYDSEKGRKALCDECYSENGRYGDDEFGKLSRCLFTLANTKWIEEDEELFAQSDIADRMARIYLKYADWPTIKKLLDKKSAGKL